MTEENKRSENSTELVKNLSEKEYATTWPYKDDTIRVYVSQNQKAGGQLYSILSRYGYIPTYPTPYDGDDFVFYVTCEPMDWHLAEFDIDTDE